MTQEHPDPLAGIDSVDWAAVDHAYGPATDVPDLLRRLQKGDSLDETYWELYGNLFHQGTRYPATIAAIPFLYRVLDDPRTPEKDRLLEYLVHLATGSASDDTDAPVGAAVAVWLDTILPMVHDPTAAAEKLRQRRAAYLAAGRTKAERQQRERALQYASSPEETVDDMLTSYRAYCAVQDGLAASVLACLTDPSPLVRTHAARVLAWFPDVQDTTRPALEGLLAGAETDAAVRATALFSMAVTQTLRRRQRGTPTPDPSPVIHTLQAAYTDPHADALIRWASSLGLVVLGRQTPEQLALVVRTLTVGGDGDDDDRYLAAYTPPADTAFPFANTGDGLATLAERELAGIKGSEQPEAAHALLQALDGALASGGAPPTVLRLAAACISVAFDGVKPAAGAAVDTFTPLQRALLRTLAAPARPAIWTDHNYTTLLEQWNLSRALAEAVAQAGE